METKNKLAQPFYDAVESVDYHFRWNLWRARRSLRRLADQVLWPIWKLNSFLFFPGDYRHIGQLLLPLCPERTRRRRMLDAWYDIAAKNWEFEMDINKWELERAGWILVDDQRISERFSAFFLHEEVDPHDPYLTAFERKVCIGLSPVNPLIVLGSKDAELMYDIARWIDQTWH